jgi:hypothetical protein
VGADEIGETASDLGIDELASRWLAAERDASARGNDGGREEQARIASAAYERAVVSASREDLLVAWHAARKAQHEREMGSASWAEARAVSELIRIEYLASK